MDMLGLQQAKWARRPDPVINAGACGLCRVNTNPWQHFYEAATNKQVWARWEDDAQLDDGGAWEVRDQVGYVGKDEALRIWRPVQ